MATSTTRFQSIICSIDGHINCDNCDCHCHIQYKVAHSRTGGELAGLLYEFWYNDVSEDDRYALILKWHTAKEITVTRNRIEEILDASTKANAKDYWSLSETYADLGFNSN